MKKYRKSVCFDVIGLGTMAALQFNRTNNPYYTGIFPSVAEGIGRLSDIYLDATNTFAKAATGFTPLGRWNATKLGLDNQLLSIGLGTGLQTVKQASGWSPNGWTNSKGNLSGAGIAGIATQGAGMVSNMLAGQNSTAAGDVMNKLGDVASIIPGPYGAIIGGGLKVVGGLTNAAFGSHLNQEFINSKTKEMGNVASLTSDALNTTDYANSFSSRQGVAGFSKKDVGSDGWFSHKARNKYRSMLAASNAANMQSVANFLSTGNAINRKNTLGQMSNLTAFGGPLEYGLAQDYINNGTLSALSKNRMEQPSMFGQTGLFAFGGNVEGDGANYPTGLTHIDVGGTHEESPYEGVQMGVDSEGTPNLVEENEVVYDDYVFSNRLKVPEQKVKKGQKATREQRLLNRYKGLTYAEAAKKIEHATGVDERPNDSIAKRGFEADLQILAMSLEKERAALELKEQKTQIDNMSAEEFALQLLQAEQQQAIQEQQLQQLQAQALQALSSDQLIQQLIALLPPEQQRQLLQMPPELQQQAILQLVAQAQQQPQELQIQQPVAAYGGNIHAEGGDMTLDDTNVVPLLPDAEVSNTDNTQQVPLGDADVALLETGVSQELPEQEQSEQSQNVEDMSTSQLNQTIDQIIQWAKQNGDRELAKQGRKARRASREDKEDFVDDALDLILLKEQQQQQLEQAEAAALALLQQIDLATPDLQLLIELLLLQLQQVEQLSPDLAQQQAMEALLQDQGQQFALGGDMTMDLPLEQQTLNSQAYIQLLQSFMEAIGSLDDQNAKDIYDQYSKYILDNDENSALSLADLTYKLYIQSLAQQSQNTYAEGGKLEESARNKITTYSDFLKFVEDNNLDIRQVLSDIRKTNKKFGAKNYDTSSVYTYLKGLDTLYKQDRFNTLVDKSNRTLLESLAKSLGITYSGDEYSNAGTGDTALRNLIKGKYNDAAYNTAINYSTPNNFKYINDPNYSYSADDINSFITNTVTPYTTSRNPDKTGKANGYYQKATDIPNGFTSITDYEASPQYQAFDEWLRQEFADGHTPSEQAIAWAKAMDNGVAEGVEHLLDNEGKPKSNILQLLFGDDTKKGRRNDGIMGIYHWNPARSRTRYQLNGRTINYDPNNPNPYFTVSDTPVITTDADGNITNTYTLTYNDLLKGTDTNTEGNSKKYTGKIPYKLPSKWPMYIGLGLSLGNLGYNILNPVNHTNGNAIISASNSMANPLMVGARYAGLEYAYNPVSNTYLSEPVLNQGRATSRDLFNASNGNTGALMSGLLQNNHNVGLQLADANIKGLQYNNGERYKHVDLGLTRDQKNYDRQLLADIANQDAWYKARNSQLEGLYKGYAMNEAADLAKGEAIGNGITDVAGMLSNIWQLNLYNNMVKYGLDTGTFGSATYKGAKGGKLRTVRVKRPKGLMF